jgi:hypothetical protein
MNDQEWQELRNKAQGIAIDEYSTEASNILRLTKQDITQIVEEAEVDKEKLSELIGIVSDASKSNGEKAEAIRNMAGFAEVVASLIGKLV